jgi:phage shock protein A
MFRKSDLRETRENLTLQILEDFYTSKLDDLMKARRSVANRATSRRRVELQLNQLQQNLNRLKSRQESASERGRADLVTEIAEDLAAEQQMFEKLQRQYALAEEAERDESRSSTILDRHVRNLRHSIDRFNLSRDSFGTANVGIGGATRADMPNETAARIAIMDGLLPADLRRAAE